jgi:hypothetical protein
MPSTFEELATLAVAVSFEAPPQISPRGYRWGLLEGDTLVCCDKAGVFVLDLREGRPLRRLSALSCSWGRRVDGGYVLEVPRTDEEGPRDGKLVFLPTDDGPPLIVPYRGYVKSWSPNNDELATFDDGRFDVRRAQHGNRVLRRRSPSNDRLA